MARFGVTPVVPLVPVLALVLGVTGVRGAYVIPGAEEHNCSQRGMDCSLSTSNCLDPAWARSHKYTPSGPDSLDLKISTRSDPKGNLLPVINASWTLKDDGSISYLKASELHVLVVSTNQNLCLRYFFNNRLAMRSPTGDKWELRADVLVVDPGQTYRVSVENIPKPELDHSISSISREVLVPGCSDPEMKKTEPCIQSGSLWHSNISLSPPEGKVLTVEFSPNQLSKQYLVLCRCGRSSISKTVTGNSSRLSASFLLDQWATTCCLFHVEIKPFFSRCGNDCPRHRSMVDFCPQPPTEVPPDPFPMAVAVSSVLLLTVALGICSVIICRRKGVRPGQRSEEAALLPKQRLEEHPTLLLIYSRDHPLFIDVVLKLAAFLQAHCGILVLLDLLDSTAVSQVGLMRWLELQRNKLQPKDKILVLCSRGVQSKWRAMCGQEHMKHQPDDLIGPFLSLFLSDMHQPGSMGRYIAAYFDEIASERDVPSFFDIAVKYKLMKHFEELYFRVLDMEKYEPRKVNHIQGIGPDEYFSSPSGCQLQNAIEKFRTFQINNPDWFEMGATDDADEVSLGIEHLEVSECIPVVKAGSKLFNNEVLVSEKVSNFYMIAPELNKNVLISENEPVLNVVTSSQNPSVLELQPDVFPNSEIFQSKVLPVFPAEDEEVPGAMLEQNEVRAAGFSCRKPEPLEMAEIDVICETEDESIADSDGCDQATAVSVGQNEPVSGSPWSKADISGSDQGYSSNVWTEPDSDDLRALQQLQQELMSDICHYDTQ